MSAKTKSILQGMIFTGWGAFLILKIKTGEIAFYINQRYLFLILAGALIFISLGLLTLVNALKTRPVQYGHDHAEHDHDEAQQPFPILGTLVIGLPLLLGLVIPSRPLGSSAMVNRGVDTTTPLIRKASGAAMSLSQSTTDRSVLDWVGLFTSASDPAMYKDQAAQVSGFVYHDPRLPKNQFFVSRFVITCCVADASALGMLVDWNGADQLPANGWVQVNGSIYIAKVDNLTLPGITAKSVSSIPTPGQPYLFP